MRWIRLGRMRLDYRLHGIEAINSRVHQPGSPASVLRQFGATIQPSAILHGPLLIHNAETDYRNLVIGDHVHVGRGVLLDLTGVLTIEDQCCVSMGCTILTHEDIGDRPLGALYPRFVAPTTIAAGAYLGANVTVLAGCSIGRRSAVGAGAVVTKPVPDGVLALGVPARVIRELELALPRFR